MNDDVKYKKFTSNPMNFDEVVVSCKNYDESIYNMNVKMNYLVKKSFTVPFPDMDKLDHISYKEVNQTLELFANKTSDPIVNRIIEAYLSQGGVKKYILKEDMNENFKKLQEDMNESVSIYYKAMYNCIKENKLDKKTLKHKDFEKIYPKSVDLLKNMNVNKKKYDDYKIKYSKTITTSAARLQIGSKKVLLLTEIY